MSKMIAIWGSPNSGKTSVAVKFGQELYNRTKSTILLFNPDTRIPTLALLFPNRKNDDLFSIGVSLNKTDIYPEDVIKQIVTVKQMKNFGILGFKCCENKYTYPTATEDKIQALLSVMKTLADYVVVDCTSDHADLFSRLALKQADIVFRLATSDLKSIAYFSSQLPLYVDPAYKASEHIQIMNLPETDLYLPIEDVKTYFHIAHILPYSRELKQQMLNGALFDMLNDKRYRIKMAEFTEMVV